MQTPPSPKPGPLKTGIAVLGLGAMGAATLYQLAKRGVDAIGIDRHAPPHTMGSSHGETRITRCAVGEGDAYVPLAQRSHAVWRALEAETGETLFDEIGYIAMAPKTGAARHHGSDDFLGRTIAVAERHGIPHEVLDAAAIASRFPGFDLTGDEVGCFEPGGGFVHPERCVATQLRLAEAHGARIVTGSPALGITQRAGSVVIATDAGSIEADQVVVAAGAWAGGLLGPPFERLLVPYRQTMHWFPVADPSLHAAGRAPVYIWLHGAAAADQFYGFPAVAGAAEIKVGAEQYDAPCDPSRVDRSTGPADAAALGAAVARRMRGAAAIPSRSVACLYTVTPDGGFVIDRHPAMDRVMVVSACSGHGFKHSAGVGEAVAQTLAEGRSAVELAPFRLARFAG